MAEKVNTLPFALGRIEAQGRADLQRGLAQQAAEMLSQYGPEGQAWAQRIQADPRAAIALAGEQGGFREIENRLRSGIAAGQSAQAMESAFAGSNMAPHEMEIFRQYGPDGLKKFKESQAEGAPEDPQMKELADGFNYWVKPGEAPQRVAPGLQKSSGGFTDEIAKTLRKDYTTRSDDFVTIRHFYDIAVANAAKAEEDPNNPGAADVALIQAYGKMIDPNSVVRNEEGRLIVEANSSTARDAINRFVRIYESAGILNPQARRNLKNQIQATYDKAAEKQASVVSEMNSELDRLQADGFMRELAMPIGISPSEARFDLGEAPATAEEFASQPVGTEITGGDGVRYRMAEDGNWDPIE